MSAATWSQLTTRTEEIAQLRATAALLEWDQQVMMPTGGGDARSGQIALLAGLVHARLVDPALSTLLDALATQDLPANQAAAVRNLRRDVARAVRVPAALVSELARAQADGFQAWLTAKETNNFAAFAPNLERIFALKRQEAAAIDPNRHPYDVLLEAFDPGTTLATLRPLFARLEAGLRPLIDAVRDHQPPPDVNGAFDLTAQKALHEEVMVALGFDKARGRLDFSEHPFSSAIARGDTRITTHLYPDDLLAGLSGTMHEAGHGMYEQGLPKELAGTTLDDAASYGLHESQSRFWENFIGRSLPFFRWLAPRVTAHTGATIAPEAMYRAANPIQASLVRIFADEATYNLHILVRFRLEVALLEGSLAVADLPAAWNAAYEDTLGLRPPTDSAGCLQDVHWGSGAVGYFPSYTLGNLYAASLAAALESELPDLWAQVERGEFAPILAWLRDRIHKHGHDAEAPEIVRAAVGDRDGVEDLLTHLWSRHGALYGVRR